DPRETLAKSPMCWLQILAVIITIGLNGLDGFDALSMSFALPGVATEWGVKPGELGILASMGLIGMALGSLLLGGVADRIGRRNTTLGCLVLMTFGMFMATTAKGVVDLSAYRVLTGLGIGGLLAAINAIAAEFANTQRRDFSVAIMSIGYPVGAVLGGLIVGELLKTHNWRSVFYFGGAVTAIFIPLVLLFVPESVYWLVRKQPAGALQKVNKVMARMGHAAVTSLPAIAADVRKRSFSDVFAPAYLAITILVSVTYFFHVTTFYYIATWAPKIVVNMGFTASQGARVLVWANVGGALGGVILGLLSQRFALKPLTITTMVLGCIAVFVFGRSPHELTALSALIIASGFFTNAAISGMYAIFAKAFPTHVRASGTGVAIGIGRGGSVIAPIVAGYLFQAGVSFPTVSLIMSLGSLCAAGVLSMLKLKPDQAEHLPESAPLGGATAA
ncbi:MAG TPA: MFS transporter, partial [Steroidobacteraceae bacterium]|nr:MFS transporter [Steroidobacteraceae bacterium]